MTQRGEIVDFAHPVAARLAVVLTDAVAHQYLADCVIVPIYYAESNPDVAMLRVPMPGMEGHVVDATRVVTVPRSWIVDTGDVCTSAQWEVVRSNVRRHLCIDQLLSREAVLPVRRARSSGTSDPYLPRQGHVRYRYHPPTTTYKLYGVLTADLFNAQFGRCTSIRLTSGAKLARAAYEVPVPGGTAIVSDLANVPNAEFVEDPPRPPRPVLLSPAELQAAARQLEAMLGL